MRRFIESAEDGEAKIKGRKVEDIISVIVTVYMVEQWLARCIGAIRNQSIANLEIVLVNDGSPDGSEAICREFAAVDSRIKIVNKENGGLSEARNAGLAAAAGAYIMFVDADDYIHPDMAKILYNTMKKTDADIVVCDFLPVADKEEPAYPKITELSEPVCYEGREIMNQLYYQNLQTVVAWNKLYKKKVFAEHGYIKGRIHDDESAIHFILHACKKTAYIKEKLYYYVQREGSMSSSRKWNYYSDGWQAYEERLAFLMENGYEQMAAFTKGHMLHYAVTQYKVLGSQPEAKAFLKHMRAVFKDMMADKEFQKGIPSDLRRRYRCFALHPACYGIYTAVESFCKKVMGVIRAVGHKVKNVLRK